MKRLQIDSLFASFDKLQRIYGDRNLHSIYGAGCVSNPKLFLVFINPTARNISSDPNWEGIRAPWLGTKQIWKMFFNVGFISKNLYKNIQSIKLSEWDSDLASCLYDEMACRGVYITNFAKCTQIDARPLGNPVLKKYSRLLFTEILQTNPSEIITFGSQVSSLILGKTIIMSDYTDGKAEALSLSGKSYQVHPVYYPVGQGMRNMKKAINTIKQITRQK